MTLSEALHMLRWQHCSIFLDNPNSNELLQYKPTNHYDEIGITYLKILPKNYLASEVVEIVPTYPKYCNIFIKDIRP